MSRIEHMLKACITVDTDDAGIVEEIVAAVEEALAPFGHHIAVDVPDSRDRQPRDRRGRFKQPS